MSINQAIHKFRNIFTPCTSSERSTNFERYWTYTQNRNGDILEDQKNLSLRKEILEGFQNNKVRSQHPLPHPEIFYRNHIKMKDDPKTLDRKTLLLTCIYKFARHEWAGISAAWETIPSMAQAKTVTEKISRYHLCEEFCHVRLFHEMFRTCQLENVEWIPMSKTTQWSYKFFSRMPEKLMSGPAFLTELMGMTFYVHVDRLLDEIFHDEPEARDRIREMLYEIMVDEMAHIGNRRNFMGNFAIRMARPTFSPILKFFFRGIPEAKYLFNFNQMVQEGLAFDYSLLPPQLIQRSWIPTYCQA